MIVHHSDKSKSELLINGLTEPIEQPADTRMYPSYKSFDAFIDVEALKALDVFIAQKIIQHIAKKKEEFFLNAHRLHDEAPHKPGAREIWLTRPQSGAEEELGGYQDLDRAELWRRTPDAIEFSMLMKFIGALPFSDTGRIIIIYDDAETSVPAHRDHLDTDLCQEFIWFRTNLRKPFYMLNQQTQQKCYVESYSAWFDTVNQYHGTDAAKGLSFSVRVDGHFSDELKQRIPVCNANRASTPALWSSTVDAAST